MIRRQFQFLACCIWVAGCGQVLEAMAETNSFCREPNYPGYEHERDTLKNSERPLPPDVHVCGSEASPNCPNGPKVRLFYTSSGGRSPQQLATFFIDNNGQGYFRDCENVRRENLEKIWKDADRNGNNTFRFWGQYASERVEAVRKMYLIDVKFRGGKWTAYRIRGPQVMIPKWINPRNEGESI